MRVEVQAVLLVAAVVCFAIAAFWDVSGRFDRVRFIALGFGLITSIPMWETVSAALK